MVDKKAKKRAISEENKNEDIEKTNVAKPTKDELMVKNGEKIDENEESDNEEEGFVSEVEQSDDEDSFVDEESDVNDSEIPPDSDSDVFADSDSELEFEPETIEGKVPSKFRESEFAKDADTSDEEDTKNTVGKIPMEWYESFPHIGYNLEGKPIMKPIRNQDELDKFLEKMENPDYWRTIHDKLTSTNHVLSEEELELVGRLQDGQFYSSAIDEHEPYVDMFTHEKMIHPLTNAPAHKRSFIPSKSEAKKVGKLVHAIKMGWLKIGKDKKSDEEDGRIFGDLWAEQDKHMSKRDQAIQKMHVPAPKEKLPSHDMSYKPPPEYLPTQQQIDEMKEKREEDMSDERSKYDVIPTSYGSLRQVPQYKHFIQERFMRNLDLYLCPRQTKLRVHMNPDDLIPDLPKPSDLRPFPTYQSQVLVGHDHMVRSVSVHPSGLYIASGCEDGTLKIWSSLNSRCLKSFKISEDEAIKCVAWCPSTEITVVAVVVGKYLKLVNPGIGKIGDITHKYMTSYEKDEDDEDDDVTDDDKKTWRDWKVVAGVDGKSEVLEIEHPKAVGKIVWHKKGDLLATTIPNNGNTQVLMHQMTTRMTSSPFSKMKGIVQTVAFNPVSPHFYVVTQRYVRIYDLLKKEFVKKLMCNSKWLSSISIHPGGDNLLVGSYDCRVSWMDLDLSSKPYQTLRYHKRAVRNVEFHQTYPLFASASDDGNVVVSHGQVYNDLLQNAQIVPVKVLKGTKVERNIGVLDVCWHPHQPWLFASGSDHVIRLFK